MAHGLQQQPVNSGENDDEARKVRELIPRNDTVSQSKRFTTETNEGRERAIGRARVTTLPDAVKTTV